ncbi:hypothetical protein NQZ68_022742 [Dissostichus eleginoides]|nr:hypothetical protein NQZ68_022742 [Dissostichus eleginoides]
MAVKSNSNLRVKTLEGVATQDFENICHHGCHFPVWSERQVKVLPASLLTWYTWVPPTTVLINRQMEQEPQQIEQRFARIGHARLLKQRDWRETREIGLNPRELDGCELHARLSKRNVTVLAADNTSAFSHVFPLGALGRPGSASTGQELGLIISFGCFKTNWSVGMLQNTQPAQKAEQERLSCHTEKLGALLLCDESLATRGPEHIAHHQSCCTLCFQDDISDLPQPLGEISSPLQWHFNLYFVMSVLPDL